MKLIKINDDLSINLESIYSIAKNKIANNNSKLDVWKEEFKELLNKFQKSPPTLKIKCNNNSDNEDNNIINEMLFNPINSSKELDSEYDEHLKIYTIELQKKIFEEIGNPPPEKIYDTKYYILLVTGVKVNIDKTIYDKLTNLKDIYIE